MRVILFMIAAAIAVPSVARAEPNPSEVTASAPRSRAPEVVGAVIAASGGLVFVYGAGRWLIGAIASDSAHPFDLVGGHCQDGGDIERHDCESRRSADDARTATANERNRHGGAVAMGVGAAIALTGTLVLVFAAMHPPEKENEKAKATRILPLDTPVHYVPPPGNGGTTILVPAIGGTW